MGGCPMPVMKRATVLLAFGLFTTSPNEAMASCVRTIPFLQIAKNADSVFIGRNEAGKEMSVLEVIRGAEPEVVVTPPGVPLASPGPKWLFALSRKPTGDGYFVPLCGEGRLAIAGEWALGTITESRTIWWQAAPLRDVLQAVLSGDSSLSGVRNPYEAIPLAETRAIGNIRVKVDPDCNVTAPKATMRVLLDDEGFIVRSMPVKGFERCVSGAVSEAMLSARLDPPRPNGIASAAWIDLVVPLPYTAPDAACPRGHAMHPTTAVVAFDGKRMVITARPSSIDETAALRVTDHVQTAELGRQIDALDLMSAPRLADFVDDEPCVPSRRDGNWSPGTLLRERSIIRRDICVQYDGSGDCPSGRWGVARPEWFSGVSSESKQIAVETDELTIPGDLFRGDVVLLVITPGKGVRPASGPLWRVPSRLIVGKEDGRDWPRLYADYLDAICRGAQTYVLESTSDLRTWDMTFTTYLNVEDFRLLGASWYPDQTPDGAAPHLDLSRVRILRGESASDPLRLVFEKNRRELEPRIWARTDAASGDCAHGQSYIREAGRRRAEEERNRLRLTDPLGVHDE